MGRIPAGSPVMKDRSSAITLWVQLCSALSCAFFIFGFWEAYRIAVGIFKQRTGTKVIIKLRGILVVLRADWRSCFETLKLFFLSLSKLPISLQHSTLRHHTLQLAEVCPVHHRHDRPPVDVSQCNLQRMVRMQERQLPDRQQRAEL